jgi:hypothetical protein
MYPLIAAWQTSGLLQKEFCERHHLRLYTFKYWLQKYKKEKVLENLDSSASNFIPLQINRPAVEQPPSEVEIQYPNGICLRLNGKPSIPIYLRY